MKKHDPPRTPISTPCAALALPLAGAVALLALAGCATTPAPERPAPAPVAEPSLEPVEIPDEAITLILLAREQARLGLVEQADASFEEAIALVRPLVERDPSLATSIEALETERARILEEAEERLVEAGEAPARDESEEALVGPEPELDPSKAEEVEEAAATIEPDWPVLTNDRVLAWLEVYTGRLSDFIADSIRRSGRWEARFREIFAEEGVPQDLIYLAHTESGFKVTAYSRAHAKGVFQFISATGRRYGLRIDWWVDERSDPEKACRASAAYLRDLYEEFGDWALALAAYNGGEGRVRRSIRHSGTRDFWEMARRRYFHRETRNYVPAIMAATLIAKNPEKFGFGHVEKDEPHQFETVTVPTPTDFEVIAKVSGATVREIRSLNPALRRMQTPPGEPGWVVRVPVGHAEGFAEKLAEIPEDRRITKITHVVRRGQTLSGLAGRYGTSVRAIQQANSMGRRTLLRVGQVLTIPRGPGAPLGGPAIASADGSYRVRRGDTLSLIARRFGTSVRRLQALNGLGRSTRIIAGQRLVVGAGRASAPVRASRRVEPGGSYTVRRGDTAWDIARHHGVALRDLLAINSMSKRSTLRPGQTLTIPKAKGRPAARAASATSGDYVVRHGDNPWVIARRHGVSLGRLLRANGLTKRAVLKPGQRLTIPGRSASSEGSSAGAGESTADGGGDYVVRYGDNPWLIARRHGVPLDRLLRANGLTRRSTLRPGQTLVIPGHGDVLPRPTHHVVRRGDTLSRIARRYGLSIDELCSINEIRRDEIIRPGDRLVVQ